MWQCTISVEDMAKFHMLHSFEAFNINLACHTIICQCVNFSFLQNFSFKIWYNHPELTDISWSSVKSC
jgi:hypothetical protein